jgi:hypothetical protein
MPEWDRLGDPLCHGLTSQYDDYLIFGITSLTIIFMSSPAMVGSKGIPGPGRLVRNLTHPWVVELGTLRPCRNMVSSSLPQG